MLKLHCDHDALVPIFTLCCILRPNMLWMPSGENDLPRALDNNKKQGTIRATWPKWCKGMKKGYSGIMKENKTKMFSFRMYDFEE